MTYADAMAMLKGRCSDGVDVRLCQAIDAITEHVDEIERRYADKEAVRFGHILRHALTSAQYFAAERAAAAEHPEAWRGRHFKRDGVTGVEGVK